jgi:ABC-type Fe3+-hydroxamate transport system substrate-binding protein
MPPPPTYPLDPERLTDALGVAHEATAAGTPPRILSLVPSLTELLCALGLGGALVGRTRYCIHPAQEVAKVPVVGGTKRVNGAQIAALRPTHVIVNIDENTAEMAAQLRAGGARLVVTHPLHPDDNVALFAFFGRLFGRDQEAASLQAQFAQAREALREAAKGFAARTGLYLIWRNPWMTASQDTYVSQMLALANIETRGHDPLRRYPEVDLEAHQGADVWLLSSEPYPFTEADAEALREAHPGLRGQVRCVDGEYVSWYGSRAIAGLAYLRAFVEGLDR